MAKSNTVEVSVEFEILCMELACSHGVFIHQSHEGEDCLIHQQGQAFKMYEGPKGYVCARHWMHKVLGSMIEAFRLGHGPQGEWKLRLERIFLERVVERSSFLIRARFGFQPIGYEWAGLEHRDGRPVGPTNTEFANPDNWKTLADA